MKASALCVGQRRHAVRSNHINAVDDDDDRANTKRPRDVTPDKKDNQTAIRRMWFFPVFSFSCQMDSRRPFTRPLLLPSCAGGRRVFSPFQGTASTRSVSPRSDDETGVQAGERERGQRRR
nr:hypothetical protein [Pandoravirus belohorizontensis]